MAAGKYKKNYSLTEISNLFILPPTRHCVSPNSVALQAGLHNCRILLDYNYI